MKNMSESRRDVYLDYAATTPTDERVVKAMLDCLPACSGNPNSLHSVGRRAFSVLEDARERIAGLLGAKDPSEVLFTAGGTESDNSAILGIPSRAAPQGGHVIVSAFEHHAVLEPAYLLEKRGYDVTYLMPRPNGRIHAEDLSKALRDDTVLVSIMHGNNEIGTVQPIAELAAVAHERKALFHTDAAQTLGKIPFNVQELGVDAASFSAHKIYGPKGVGALYLKRGTPFEPLIRGGGQEFKKRSGTQNVPGIVAFARAIELADAELTTESERLEMLRERIFDSVKSRIENIKSATPPGPHLPNIINLIIAGIEGESMLLHLDARGISVSTGSACSSGSLEPSHVLTAIGHPAQVAHESLRISIGRFTTEEEVDYFLETLPKVVERVRALSRSGAQ